MDDPIIDIHVHFGAPQDYQRNRKSLHVIGIPRINLSLISSRIANSKENLGVLNWNLPLEMIIAAVVED